VSPARAPDQQHQVQSRRLGPTRPPAVAAAGARQCGALSLGEACSTSSGGRLGDPCAVGRRSPELALFSVCYAPLCCWWGPASLGALVCQGRTHTCMCPPPPGPQSARQPHITHPDGVCTARVALRAAPRSRSIRMPFAGSSLTHPSSPPCPAVRLAPVSRLGSADLRLLGYPLIPPCATFAVMTGHKWTPVMHVSLPPASADSLWRQRKSSHQPASYWLQRHPHSAPQPQHI
jgi:hypothetical protein